MPPRLVVCSVTVLGERGGSFWLTKTITLLMTDGQFGNLDLYSRLTMAPSTGDEHELSVAVLY